MQLLWIGPNVETHVKKVEGFDGKEAFTFNPASFLRAI